MGISVELALILLAIILNGFFAASEIALVSARVSRLASIPSKGAALAKRLKESPETFLATVQIGITLVGTLASAVGGATAVGALTPLLSELGLGGAAQPTALGVVVILLTYVSLVLGELAPKAIALQNPERLAALAARPIYMLSRVSAGLVRLLTVSTNVVLRVLRLGGASESPFISEEEVRYLVREGAAKGIFERTEEQLVHNVFEFADTTVRQVMVPRPNIQGIDVNTPWPEVVRLAAQIGHSRIPVYREDINHPVGVFSLKDLLRALATGRSPELVELLQAPSFVPETTKIGTVLRQFQRQRNPMALVVDEYGAVVGLITVEDILEEIVGEIGESAGGDDGPHVSRLADGALVVDGLVSIDDLRRAGVPVDDSAEYTTAAGAVMTWLGAIPAAGTAVTHGGYRWTVVEADGPRLRKLRIERA